MISTLNISVMGLSLAITLGFLIFFIIRYRKARGFGKYLTFGLLGSMVFNIFSNLFLSAVQSTGIAGEFPILYIFLVALISALGLLAAYQFIDKIQMRMVDDAQTASVNALGFVILQAITNSLYLFNAIQYSFLNNSNALEQAVSEEFTLEMIQAQVDIVKRTAIVDYADLLVGFFTIFIIYKISFEIIRRVNRQQLSWKSLGLIMSGWLLYFFLVNYFLSIMGNTALAILVRLIIVAAFFVYYKRYVGPTPAFTAPEAIIDVEIKEHDSQKKA